MLRLGTSHIVSQFVATGSYDIEKLFFRGASPLGERPGHLARANVRISGKSVPVPVCDGGSASSARPAVMYLHSSATETAANEARQAASTMMEVPRSDGLHGDRSAPHSRTTSYFNRLEPDISTHSGGRTRSLPMP